MGNKTEVNIFVSYARSNKNLAGRFLNRFKEQLQASQRYDYIFWQDEKILIGEEWNAAIENALNECTAGLFLLSPAFLGSKYISENELPRFVGNTAKPVLPVMLQSVDFELMDLKGIKKYQIFRLEGERFNAPKSFGDCTGNQRERFVQELFRNVERRITSILRNSE